MPSKIRLYDYQEEMLSRIGKAFLTHRSVMAQMPTGTGKTVLLAGYLARSAEERVLIVAHRRELVEQIEETVGRLFRENGMDARTEELICVHSIQWLTRHYDDIAPHPSLVVVDSPLSLHRGLFRAFSTESSVRLQRCFLSRVREFRAGLRLITSTEIKSGVSFLRRR